jgi:cell division septal protein FtsQ
MEKSCNGCGTNESLAVMPIAQHEKDQNRLMKIIKWLVAVVALLIVLLVGSNVGWLIYESSFETVETVEEYQVEQDGSINNSVINGGEIVNGETESNIS